MIYLLDQQIGFPDPREGDEDGLFAIGGDLSPARLQLAYSYGIFPWYAFRAEDTNPTLINPADGKPYIQWWCPMQRFVIFPDEIHISHSMRQELHKLHTGRLRVTIGRAFDQVIDQCGKLREEGLGAWLGDDMKAAYRELHRLGMATSVEVWQRDDSATTASAADATEPTDATQQSAPVPNHDALEPNYRLVGGLYGVTLGNGFFGESMFSLIPSASKVALICLARLLKAHGGGLIDCQFETPHLKTMGGRYISYDEYLSIIQGKNQASR